MKRPNKNALQTSIIKMGSLPPAGRLHPIPYKTFNFNWMKSFDKIRSILMATIILSLMVSFGCTQKNKLTISDIMLDKNWSLQPYGEWSDDGQLITADVYSPSNKISCEVPTTVFAALVKSGKFSNPYFSDNLKRVPKEWFKTHWRYTNTFDLSDGEINAFTRLCFDGINYSADVFLNGQKIASADTIKGAFRRFEIDVTGQLKKQGNELEVNVFPPKAGDFTIGFVDWTPRPPDENMGLFRGVHLRFNGPVSVENPFVKSKINPTNQNEAALTIESIVINHSETAIKTTVKAQFENILLNQEVNLEPKEKKVVVFSPEEFPQLNLTNAKLWWPVTMGDPNLYTIELSAETKNTVSDIVSKTFGIREVSDYINEQGSRMYKVNGRDIQIRSGGWTDDLLLREDAANVEAQVQYTKLMNLNCIRLEGFWGSSEKLYDECDKEGLLLMTGWSCQWEWEDYVGKECDEFGGIKTPEEMALINQSFDDHVMWLRHHPSIFVWVLGSDKVPRPALENMYLKTLSASDPTRPALMACQMIESEITGNTGVKMYGPYDYVTPNYWYVDTKNGGAYGFNTETGPGPQIPPIESLRKMFPEDKLWPINEIWDYHCGRHEFHTIDRYLNALNNRYGEAHSIEEFVGKAQLANYEAIRPMFEAFALNKTEAGGIVQWMLNASWPKLYWQLYDYYLMPNGAFFGTLNALKPLNIIYNYGDKNIYVSNDNLQAINNLTAEIRILDINSKEIFFQNIPFEVDAYSSKQVFDMPVLKETTSTYFADLRIKSADGKEVAKSFYWLSNKEDVLDYENSKWFVTPNKSFADFTALSAMPKTEIASEVSVEIVENQTVVKVNLKNPSDKLAFFIELKAKGSTSDELILPVFWSDNYVSLLPGEEQTLTLKMNTNDLKGEQPVIEIKGFNTK